MRIAELLNNLEMGGAERLAADLSHSLRSRGHEVHAVCLRDLGPLAKPFALSGIEVVALGKPEGFHKATVQQLVRYLEDRHIEVLHSHNPLVHHYAVLAGRLARVPVIVNTIHGPSNLESWRTRVIYEASSLFSDRIVSVCPAFQHQIEKRTWLVRHRSVAIGNGIDLGPFGVISPRHEEDDLVIGTVARLVPVKDQQLLLRALKLVHQKNPRVRLELLGDGPLRGSLEKTSRDLGIADRVRFHGASDRVPEFLSRLDVFVLCSSSEGLPITLLEAMAAARPVVSTAVGGIPDLVTRAGCGWLCPPGEPEALTEALVGTLQSPRRVEFGLRGREYVQAHHSLASMTDEYTQLFEQLLAAKYRRASSGPRRSTYDINPEPPR